jgi:hypothetical protein
MNKLFLSVVFFLVCGNPLISDSLTAAEKLPPRGNYEVYLWNHGVYRPAFPNHQDPTFHLPVPATLVFDDEGNFYGTVDYDLPESHMLSLAGKTGPRQWKTSFEVRGTVDPKTGDILVKIDRGRIIHAIGDGKGYRSGYEVEYSSTLKGKYYRPLLAKNTLKIVYRIDRGDDRDLFLWGGNTGQDKVSVDIDVKKHVQFSGIQKLDPDDYTARTREQINKLTSLGWIWNLYIAGPAKEKPTGEKGKNLVSFTVWPETPVQMKTGESKRFYALGVFDDGSPRMIDLTRESLWEPGPGLALSKAGICKATEPGKQTLRAGFKSEKGWVYSSVEITVAGK